MSHLGCGESKAFENIDDGSFGVYAIDGSVFGSMEKWNEPLIDFMYWEALFLMIRHLQAHVQCLPLRGKHKCHFQSFNIYSTHHLVSKLCFNNDQEEKPFLLHTQSQCSVPHVSSNFEILL